MRQSVRSTVSGAASAQRAPACVLVTLLDRQTLTYVLEPTMKTFQDIFMKVCEHIGLREGEFFGLAQLIDGEYHFLNLDSKIKSLKQRSWRLHHHSFEPAALRTLYFRVRYYVDNIQLLRERATRHQYYLQLRDNLLHYAQLTNESKCFQLAAFALQADQGPYVEEEHVGHYFDPQEYFPAWVVTKHGADFLVKSMPAIHKDLGSISKPRAEIYFIKDLSEFPQQHNLHFYRLQKKKGDDAGTAWLGVGNSGVQIFEEQQSFKSVLSTFLWTSIAKISFDKKKLEIRAEGAPQGRKFVYYTGSEGRSKYLLAMCRATHLCHMTTMKAKADELQQFQAEDHRRFKESYIYSSNRDVTRQRGAGSSAMFSVRSRASLVRQQRQLASAHVGPLLTSPSPGGPLAGVGDQRVSLVSNTSSNTTSGICSERMAVSFDESEDGVDGRTPESREIMITTPPSTLADRRRHAHVRIVPFVSLRSGVGSVGVSTPPLTPSACVSSTPMTSPDHVKTSADSGANNLSLTPISSSPQQSEASTPVGTLSAAQAGVQQAGVQQAAVSPPRPADTHIHRTPLQAMTVSSKPVRGYATSPEPTRVSGKTYAITGISQPRMSSLGTVTSSLTSPVPALPPYRAEPLTSTPAISQAAAPRFPVTSHGGQEEHTYVNLPPMRISAPPVCAAAVTPHRTQPSSVSGTPVCAAAVTPHRTQPSSVSGTPVCAAAVTPHRTQPSSVSGTPAHRSRTGTPVPVVTGLSLTPVTSDMTFTPAASQPVTSDQTTLLNYSLQYDPAEQQHPSQFMTSLYPTAPAAQDLHLGSSVGNATHAHNSAMSGGNVPYSPRIYSSVTSPVSNFTHLALAKLTQGETTPPLGLRQLPSYTTPSSHSLAAAATPPGRQPGAPQADDVHLRAHNSHNHDLIHRRKSSYDSPAVVRPRRDPERRHTTDNYRLHLPHDVSASVAAELEGLSDKHQSLPLLTALFNDKDLQAQFSCGGVTSSSASRLDAGAAHAQGQLSFSEDLGTVKLRSSQSIDSTTSSHSAASGRYGGLVVVNNNNNNAPLVKPPTYSPELPGYQSPPAYDSPARVTSHLNSVHSPLVTQQYTDVGPRVSHVAQGYTPPAVRGYSPPPAYDLAVTRPRNMYTADRMVGVTLTSGLHQAHTSDSALLRHLGAAH